MSSGNRKCNILKRKYKDLANGYKFINSYLVSLISSTSFVAWDKTKIKMRKLFYSVNIILASIILLESQAFGQGEFITLWNLSITGSGSNSLTFGVSTSGIAMYTAETLPSGPNINGTFTGTTLTITGLPTNARIRLKISPTNFNRININNGVDKSRLVGIEQWGTTQWSTMASAFWGCNSLSGTGALDVPDLSRVTNMFNMFRNATLFNHPIGNWDVSKVIDMSSIFFEARSFNQPIGNWNTSSVTNMRYLFFGANSFNQNINNWDVSNVVSMEYMFNSATAFNQQISNWNVGNVTAMNYMFRNATAFNQPIGNWNVSNVTTMELMFAEATSFNQPIGNWDVSKVTNMSHMFYLSTAFNQPIGNWNVSNVTNMLRMFNEATSFNQPIGNWNVGNVTNMAQMFQSASSFNQPVGNWDVGKVTNMVNMFAIASAFNQNLSAWANKLVSTINLDAFISQSGINAFNYDALLESFNASQLTGRTLGANGIRYCTASAARANLVLPVASGGKGWGITDAGLTTPSGLVTIVSQPVGNTICSGNSHTFNASASGTNLSYIWGNGSNQIVGYGNSFTTGIPGRYTVTVSGNACISAVSSPAVLLTDVAIVQQPASVNTTPGTAQTFSVSATGSNLSYRWSNGLSNTNSMTTSITGTYFVTVSGTCGFEISLPAHYNSEFITLWNLTNSGSGFNERLNFGAQSSGPVYYRWETFPLSTLAGSGIFNGNNFSTYSLPRNSIIKLFISPANFQRIIMNNGTDRNRLVDILQWGSTSWTSMQNAFTGCNNLSGIGANDIPNLGNVNNLTSMFQDATLFNHPIGNWNIENVTSTGSMFFGASSFNQPLNLWNTSNVVNMGSMFYNATAFNQTLNNWDVSKVTMMFGIFYSTKNFNQPLNNWDVSKVTNTYAMFYDNPVFNQPIGNWNVSNVTDMRFMFRGTNFNQPIGNWDVSKVFSMQGMFALNPVFNQPIGNWNVSSVTGMGSMFNGATSFNQPLNNWDVSKVTILGNMFTNATGFNQPLDKWNISNATLMSSMFDLATSFNQNLGSWGTKLNPSANITGFVNNSGLSSLNYDALIQGFNIGTVTGRNLGALNMVYCGSSSARANLTTSGIGNKNWTITGDSFGSSSIGATITSQPTDNSICPGVSHLFTASATGNNLSYIWTDNSNTIVSEGQQFATSVTGIYTVSVFGRGCMSAVSSPVTLSALPPTSINVQPLSSATVCSGLSQTFSLSATGANLSYVWNSGEPSRIITTSTAGIYTVTVSGTCGSLTSTPAVLTVESCNLLNISSSSNPTPIFSIYPNPATRDFAIETNSASNYSISDVWGNTVLQGELKAGPNPNLTISTKGMYLIRIGNQTRKLVVE